MKTAAVYFVYLNGNNLFQLLDTALHLDSLGRFVSETLDEILDVGYFLLLILVGSQLLLAPFLTQLHILIILHPIVNDLAAGYLQRAVTYIVDKGAVVTHQYHRLGRLCEESLQPLYAVDVKMVRGLVEQEDIGAREQQFGKLYTHTPTATELAGRTVEVFS